MVFYIHDQGARVSTPIDRLLVSKDVEEVDKIPAVRRLGPEVPSEATEQYTATLLTGNRERSQLLYAQDIMSSPVHTGPPLQKLDECRAMLAEHGFHHMPVVDQQGALCGIVSDRDLLRFAASRQPNWRVTTGQVMTNKVISAATKTEIRAIAEVMCRQAIGALPIVSEANTVVGIVTRSDILRALVNRAPIELWA